MTRYFTLPSPFETEWGTLLLLEPPGSSENRLRQQLLDGSYDRPFVVDDGQLRYLYFSTTLMQSAMRIARPHDLELSYTRKMMAGLLFHPRPKRIVLIGLGGGSLAKFCYARLPGSTFTAIELSEDVIALRDAFFLPVDNERFQVIQGDGAEFLATTEKGIDLLLIDAFDKTGFAPSLANRAFFEQARKTLSGKGVLIMNLAGEQSHFEGVISQVMEVFDDQVIVIPVPEDGNHILYAFREQPFMPRWRWLHNHAKELRAHHGLDFPAFVDALERADKLGYARREAYRKRT